MKPDLTYYHHNFSLSLKNFWYFLEQIPSKLSNPKLPKKIYP